MDAKELVVVMTESCAIQLADRLRSVRISLRGDLEVSRHVFHGRASYVLRDPITFETHRLSSADYQVVTHLDRAKTLGEIFDALCRDNCLSAADEQDFYGFIVSLQRLGLLTQPDADGRTLFERYNRRSELERRSKLLGFLFLQVPLVNPDRFLKNTRFVGQIVFSKLFVVAWCVAIAASIWLLSERWAEFAEPIDAVLAGRSLVTVWVTLLGLKVLHELGHGWACKHYGGQVPEMGAFFIAMNPCAYVDASAAWGFPRRWSRVVVSLGGVYFESFAAMAALWFWAFSDPSLARSTAHHIVVMASLATFLFNLNPLLRYDGYFILCDVTGIPNLRQKAIATIQAHLKSVFIGLPLEFRYRANGTNVCLAMYAVAATIYKASIVLTMSALIAARLPAIGLLLAVYYVGLTVGSAAWRLFRFLWVGNACRGRRLRAAFCSAGLIVLAAVLLLAPAPQRATTTGVLTREHVRSLRTVNPGFLSEIFVQAGQEVKPGACIARLANIDLDANVAEAASQLESLRIERRRFASDDQPVDAIKLERQARHVAQRLRSANEDVATLEMKSNQNGRILRCLNRRQLGQFLPSDTPVAEIGWGRQVVTAWMPAESFTDAKPSIGDLVACRFHAHPDRVLSGQVVSISPVSQRQFEHLELTQMAGGEIVVDPHTRLSEESRFQVIVVLDTPLPETLRDGSRATIRLNHPTLTMAEFAWRRLQRGLQRLNYL